jgi:hypothetical protein
MLTDRYTIAKFCTRHESPIKKNKTAGRYSDKFLHDIYLRSQVGLAKPGERAAKIISFFLLHELRT